jgi:formylglycine-generating enzyme required for sulfatase activity
VVVPRRSRVTDLLPPPFEWIEIPAGRVTLVTEKGWDKNYIPEGTSQTFDVPAFMIAKYPLTNAQYAKFVEAGGYREPKWWTDVGWEAREQGWDWNPSKIGWETSGTPWTEPRYWQDKKWNGADYPVVGVSWYEAIAFCRWLSETTGEDVTLPTEQQWQRAAQGDDGRIYPWGNRWAGKRCNNRVSPQDSNQTTPVTQYPNGASPYGVLDMSGNVGEWCLTAYESGSTSLGGTDDRVLRGGAWDDTDTDHFRASYRGGNHPNDGNGDWGFRCARSR